jgi:hypothetical protein
VGSVLLTPQPLSAAEMVALVCFDIEQQLRLKLGRDSLAKGSKSLQILSHAECASGDQSLRMFESIQQLARLCDTVWFADISFAATSGNLHVMLNSCVQLSAASAALPVIVIAAETRTDLLFFEE